MPIRIAIDAMGGDLAPESIVEGAVLAAKEFEVQVYLVGNEKAIIKELSKFKRDNLPIYIKHASEIVNMDESPTVAFRRKKDSSIRKAFELLKSGLVDAVVSAGNTGAVMTTGKMILGALEGVERPAIAALIPTKKGKSILLDAGANVDCKPRHLFQFAIMGYIYAKNILGIINPKVGLLSIGEEDSKGNELTKNTFKLLKQSFLNFIGNVEGKDVYKGRADVIICDGFIGNIALKVSESLAEVIEYFLREEFKRNIFAKLGYFLVKPALRKFGRKVDYSEYGGAPLLGLNGTCIICHGRSSPKAIKNAIKVAIEAAKLNISEKIKESIKTHFHQILKFDLRKLRNLDFNLIK